VLVLPPARKIQISALTTARAITKSTPTATILTKAFTAAPPNRLHLMESRQIPESELILHPDGSVFHLRLLPEQLGNIVFTVGDPDRGLPYPSTWTR